VNKQLVDTLNTLNNLSKLRNIWLRSPDERMRSWREFRLELQESYNACNSESLLSSLDAINTWWSFAPSVNMSIDPYSSDNWPTVWEIIADGKVCNYSRGLAMAYNSHYLDPDLKVTAARVIDGRSNDEYFVAVANDIVLNAPAGRAVNLKDVDYIKTQEQWEMREYLRRTRN
jgi:hypothetical protein